MAAHLVSPVVFFFVCFMCSYRTLAEAPVCGSPTQLTQGSISPVKTAYLAGERVTYTCHPDATMQPASVTRTCLESGTWTGLQPQCLSARKSMYLSAIKTELRLNDEGKYCTWTSQLERHYLVNRMEFHFSHTANVARMNITLQLLGGEKINKIVTLAHELRNSTKQWKTEYAQYNITDRLTDDVLNLTVEAMSPAYIKEISFTTENCRKNGLSANISAKDVSETCSPPPVPLHSIVSYSNKTANYSCLPGYELFPAVQNEHFLVVNCIDGIWNTSIPLCHPDGSLVSITITYASAGGSLLLGSVMASMVVSIFFFRKQKELNKVKLRIPSYIHHRKTAVHEPNDSEAPAEEIAWTTLSIWPHPTSQPNIKQPDHLMKDLKRKLLKVRKNYSVQIEVHEAMSDRHVVGHTYQTDEMMENDYVTMNGEHEETDFVSDESVYCNRREAVNSTANEAIYSNDEPIYGNM